MTAPHDGPRPDALLKRIGLAAVGAALLTIGIVSLPVPLFPSLLCLALGAICMARASTRMRRWLAAQPWLARSLAQVSNARLRARLAALLGIGD